MEFGADSIKWNQHRYKNDGIQCFSIPVNVHFNLNSKMFRQHNFPAELNIYPYFIQGFISEA
jgi:hypothetical protein